MPERPSDVFFLDECLPSQVAEALRLVFWPITNPIREDKRGIKDEVLIPWLADNQLVWITKDDEAKRDHLPTIIRHRLSVVWVRGIDRRKNKISPQELHLMLTVRMPRLVSKYSTAHGPQHHLLYLNGEKPTLSGPLNAHTLRLKHERSSRTG